MFAPPGKSAERSGQAKRRCSASDLPGWRRATADLRRSATGSHRFWRCHRLRTGSHQAPEVVSLSTAPGHDGAARPYPLPSARHRLLRRLLARKRGAPGPVDPRASACLAGANTGPVVPCVQPPSLLPLRLHLEAGAAANGLWDRAAGDDCPTRLLAEARDANRWRQRRVGLRSVGALLGRDAGVISPASWPHRPWPGAANGL